MSNAPTIPEIPLLLAPRTPEAQSVIGFQWASDGVGERSKLGGEPDWIQQSSVPTCSCGEHMSFYGQLDSIGDKICLADCGMIYVFICFGCFQTQAIFQCS